jgi:hypothetical protein
MVSGKPDLDVVVFGPTGFVGRLVARYLADHAAQGVRVGPAGRSAERLRGVGETGRSGVGLAAAGGRLDRLFTCRAC